MGVDVDRNKDWDAEVVEVDSQGTTHSLRTQASRMQRLFIPGAFGVTGVILAAMYASWGDNGGALSSLISALFFGGVFAAVSNRRVKMVTAHISAHTLTFRCEGRLGGGSISLPLDSLKGLRSEPTSTPPGASRLVALVADREEELIVRIPSEGLEALLGTVRGALDKRDVASVWGPVPAEPPQANEHRTETLLSHSWRCLTDRKLPKWLSGQPFVTFTESRDPAQPLVIVHQAHRDPLARFVGLPLMALMAITPLLGLLQWLAGDDSAHGVIVAGILVTPIALAMMAGASGDRYEVASDTIVQTKLFPRIGSRSITGIESLERPARGGPLVVHTATGPWRTEIVGAQVADLLAVVLQVPLVAENRRQSWQQLAARTELASEGSLSAVDTDNGAISPANQ